MIRLLLLICTFIGAFIVIRFIFRLLFGYRHQQKNNYYSGQSQDHDDVNIKYNPKKEKRFDSNMGEYVDYEDIRDDKK